MFESEKSDRLVLRSPGTLRSPPSCFKLSRDELDLFSFFCERTRLQISEYFRSEFWTTVVVRMAAADEVVQRALVALAACQPVIRADIGSHPRLCFMEQYNIAVKHHLGQLANSTGLDNPELRVTTSLIFIAIEVCEPASSHDVSIYSNT
jgi:hypothetical protein